MPSGEEHLREVCSSDMHIVLLQDTQAKQNWASSRPHFSIAKLLYPFQEHFNCANIRSARQQSHLPVTVKSAYRMDGTGKSPFLLGYPIVL